MHIDYYNGDYKRTNTPKPITTTSAGENRYDGNIKATRWGTRDLDGFPHISHNAYLYSYNENKWLEEAEYGSADNYANVILNPSGNYKVSNLTYDANGNLLSLSRNSNNNVNNAMDNFTYNYNNQTNRLNFVYDAVAATGLDDLQDQMPDNYIYNSIGQMIMDNGDATKYAYNASGLVTHIRKGSFEMKIYYNDRGHRVRKESTTDGNTWNETYYVRDASGSVMAIYNGSYGANSNEPKLAEQPIYGASRLGVFNRLSGRSSYQFTDHLGNVRAVLTDQTISNYTDYYPFGMPMPNRNIQGDYRYAFQGQEKDPETGMEAFELRLWDSRIGRWLTTDPARQYASPYLGMGNNPINGIDPDGAVYNPVYGANGEGLLGTTESGLQGEAIIMNASDFVQGMSDSEAFSKGSTVSQLMGMASSLGLLLGTGNSMQSYMKSHTNSLLMMGNKLTGFDNLSSRPDWDGQLTGSEVKKWRQTGKGNPLYVDFSKINFVSSGLYVKDFTDRNATELSVNFFRNFNIHRKNSSVLWKPASEGYLGGMYGPGTVTVVLLDPSKGSIMLKPTLHGKYFDINDYASWRRWIAGGGDDFPLAGYGTGFIKQSVFD
jgi:RHS repeat-associated protein